MRFLRSYLTKPLLILLFGPSVWASSDYRIDVPFMQARTLEQSSYVLINHAEPRFDSERVSTAAIQRMLQLASARGIETIGIINTVPRVREQFYQPQDIQIGVDSFGGTHELSFPNLRLAIVGGGNASQCLSRAVSDLIAGTKANTGPIRIFLVTDAIYESPLTLDEKEFLASLGLLGRGDQFTLADLIKVVESARSLEQRKRARKYFENLVLEKFVAGAEVKEYLIKHHGFQNSSDLDFRVIWNGSRLDPHRENASKKYEFVLIHSSELSKQI